MTSKAKTADCFARATMVFSDHDYHVVENDVRAMPSARAGRQSPSLVSQSRPFGRPSTIASKFAEQHQVDPDEAYRDAVYAEIGAKLRAFAGLAVMVLVAVTIGVMLAVGHS